MTYTISKTVLVDDCCLLFDSEIINYVDFLNKLSPRKLRSAYRRKAFATHPDRAHALGKNRKKLDKCFKEMSTAYERLDSIIQSEKKYIIKDAVPKKRKPKSASCRTPAKKAKPVKKTKPPKKAKSTKQAKPKQTKSPTRAKSTKRSEPKKQTKTTKQKSPAGSSLKSSVRKASSTQMTVRTKTAISDRYFSGIVPKRELLIGQFLYYSGLISWNTLTQAIVWQRRQRPIIGKIAQDWGILSAEDIKSILRERSYKDHFGEYALRNGYITSFQHSAIVGKQKQMQPPIGRYFIQQGLLRNYDIKKMTESLRIHNRSNKQVTKTI
ncbi:MAG: J domain-containing protein [Candidatus Brocadiales bacterium]|nr:J domain-containing protein [Candidatus Brocadiales bacterium]